MRKGDYLSNTVKIEEDESHVIKNQTFDYNTTPRDRLRNLDTILEKSNEISHDLDPSMSFNQNSQKKYHRQSFPRLNNENQNRDSKSNFKFNIMEGDIVMLKQKMKELEKKYEDMTYISNSNLNHYNTNTTKRESRRSDNSNTLYNDSYHKIEDNNRKNDEVKIFQNDLKNKENIDHYATYGHNRINSMRSNLSKSYNYSQSQRKSTPSGETMWQNQISTQRERPDIIPTYIDRLTADKTQFKRKFIDKLGYNTERKYSKSFNIVKHMPQININEQSYDTNFDTERPLEKSDIYPQGNSINYQTFGDKKNENLKSDFDMKKERKFGQYERFHDKIQKLVIELSPPGTYASITDPKEVDQRNTWRFVKDLVNNYANLKKDYSLLEQKVKDF